MTTGCFPAPVEGELLYGMLARHRLLSGARTAADHATELFGRRAAIATFDLPCRLDALAARLPAAAELDGNGLLSHTLYPFYAAYQPAETREIVERDLRSSELSNAHHRLGVAAFRIRAARSLRFCPECLDGQLSGAGVATWLVPHQLPGALVCAEHGVWLRDSLVTRTTAGRHGYVSPSEANCPRLVDVGAHPAGDAASVQLQALSRAMAALARSLAPAQPLDHWREHYVERVRNVGLMRSARKVDQVALNDGVRSHWGSALPLLPAPCSNFGESGWVAAMVRSHRKAMHPLLHLMLDGFLGHLERGGVIAPDAEGASAAGRKASPPSRDDVRVTFVAGRATRLDWPALDRRLRQDIETAASAIACASPPVRVSRAEIERRVAKLDWFGKRRHKLPAALCALAAAEETVLAYRRRRAEHWIRTLGPACRAWEVMRAAGLRSEHLPMIRQAMTALAAASAAR